MLATCTEPIVEGAPDLRGLWRTLRAVRAEEDSSRLLSILRFLFWKMLGVERTRTPVPADHPIYVYVERIERVHAAVDDRVTASSLGDHDFKGFSRAVSLYQIDGVR